MMHIKSQFSFDAFWLQQKDLPPVLLQELELIEMIIVILLIMVCMMPSEQE